MIRTRFPRTSTRLPAPIPLYPIAIGLPPNETQLVKGHDEASEPVYVVPIDNLMATDKQDTGDALDAEIVDILRNPSDKGQNDVVSMYDRLVNDGRSCYMSSESHHPFFIGDAPFGFKESLRKSKQNSTKVKILSWILRSPASRKVSH